jgi:hypothetical protein
MFQLTSTRRYTGAVVFTLLFLGGVVGFAAETDSAFAAMVSEPAALTLLGLGLIVMAAGYRRRREDK